MEEQEEPVIEEPVIEEPVVEEPTVETPVVEPSSDEPPTQLDLLKQRIPNTFGDNTQYEQVLNQLLDDAKNIALANLYPFEDWSEMELPRKYLNWQLRACVEIYTSLGPAGVKSYSENGLSFTREEGQLSSSLMEELISKAGTISTVIPEKED